MKGLAKEYEWVNGSLAAFDLDDLEMSTSVYGRGIRGYSCTEPGLSSFDGCLYEVFKLNCERQVAWTDSNRRGIGDYRPVISESTGTPLLVNIGGGKWPRKITMLVRQSQPKLDGTPAPFVRISGGLLQNDPDLR